MINDESEEERNNTLEEKVDDASLKEILENQEKFSEILVDLMKTGEGLGEFGFNSSEYNTSIKILPGIIEVPGTKLRYLIGHLEIEDNKKVYNFPFYAYEGECGLVSFSKIKRNSMDGKNIDGGIVFQPSKVLEDSVMENEKFSFYGQYCDNMPSLTIELLNVY